MTSLHWAHTLIAMFPLTMFIQAPDRVHCAYAHPHLSGCLTYCHGDGTALMMLAPRKEGYNLLLINVLKRCDLMHSPQLNHTVDLQCTTLENKMI